MKKAEKKIKSKNTSNEKKENILWNIVKAIGIISIVIGHTANNIDLIHFVYSYHLVIFFFVAGVCFNEDKYATSPYEFIITRLKTNWWPYFTYATTFTLLHNIMVKFHLLKDGVRIAIKDIFRQIGNNTVFQSEELMAGALWFVPVLIIGLIIFIAIINLSNRINKKYKYQFQIICISLIGLSGILANLQNVYMAYHMQTSFLIVPIIWIGYLFTTFKDKIKINNIILYILYPISFSVLYYVIIIKGNIIGLDSHQIISWYAFYPISLIGIYFICISAKLLIKTKYISKWLNYIGKKSFDIMALHFLIIKIIDYIICSINHDSYEIFQIFPASNKDFYLLYVLASITLAPILADSYRKIYRMAFNKIFTK